MRVHVPKFAGPTIKTICVIQQSIAIEISNELKHCLSSLVVVSS